MKMTESRLAVLRALRDGKPMDWIAIKRRARAMWNPRLGEDMRAIRRAGLVEWLGTAVDTYRITDAGRAALAEAKKEAKP